MFGTVDAEKMSKLEPLSSDAYSTLSKTACLTERSVWGGFWKVGPPSAQGADGLWELARGGSDEGSCKEWELAE